MKYTIYDQATGEILRWGEMPEEAVPSQLREGEAVIEGEFAATSFYFDGTAIVAKPVQPTPFHIWNTATSTWTIPLATAKEVKWSEMKTARAAAIEHPLATPFGTFDADDEARNNIIHTAQLMQTEAQTLAPGEAPTVQFTLANNTVVELTAGQMVQVAMLLASQIQTAYAHGRVVRAMIEAATTAEEVAAITW